jgi:hypothetical protein
VGVDLGNASATVEGAEGAVFRVGVSAFPDRERRVREGDDGVGIEPGTGVDCLLRGIVLVFLGVTGDGRGSSSSTGP